MHAPVVDHLHQFCASGETLVEGAIGNARGGAQLLNRGLRKTRVGVKGVRRGDQASRRSVSRSSADIPLYDRPFMSSPCLRYGVDKYSLYHFHLMVMAPGIHHYGCKILFVEGSMRYCLRRPCKKVTSLTSRSSSFWPRTNEAGFISAMRGAGPGRSTDEQAPSRAVVTAAVRSATPSLSKTRSRWVLTVASLMNRPGRSPRWSGPGRPGASTSTSRGGQRSAPGRARPAVTSRARHRRGAGRSRRGPPPGPRGSSRPGGVLQQVAGGAGLDRPQDVAVVS